MNIIVPFLIFTLAFIIHKYLIYPLELFFLNPKSIEHASFLYLPHAVRIITYYLMGPIVLIPIFLSQCFTFLVFNDAELFDTLSLSTISTLSIFFGFALYDLIKEDKRLNIYKAVDWKKIIIIGFFVSIFNSSLSSLYLLKLNGLENFYVTLNFTYLFGDVLGLVFGMILFILGMKIFARWRNSDSL